MTRVSKRGDELLKYTPGGAQTISQTPSHDLAALSGGQVRRSSVTVLAANGWLGFVLTGEDARRRIHQEALVAFVTVLASRSWLLPNRTCAAIRIAF